MVAASRNGAGGWGRKEKSVLEERFGRARAIRQVKGNEAAHGREKSARTIIIEAEVGRVRLLQHGLEKVGRGAQAQREDARQLRGEVGQLVVVGEDGGAKVRRVLLWRELVEAVEVAVGGVVVGQRPVHWRRRTKVEPFLPIAPLLGELIIVPAPRVAGRPAHGLFDLPRNRKVRVLLLHCARTEIRVHAVVDDLEEAPICARVGHLLHQRGRRRLAWLQPPQWAEVNGGHVGDLVALDPRRRGGEAPPSRRQPREDGRPQSRERMGRGLHGAAGGEASHFPFAFASASCDERARRSGGAARTPPSHKHISDLPRRACPLLSLSRVSSRLGVSYPSGYLCSTTQQAHIGRHRRWTHPLVQAYLLKNMTKLCSTFSHDPS